MSGSASYRVQLERLLALLQGAQGNPLTYKMAGDATGQIQLASAGSVTTAKGTADIANFVYATLAAPAGSQANQPAAWQTVWNEPKLNVTADGQYDSHRTPSNCRRFSLRGRRRRSGCRRVQDPTGRCISSWTAKWQ